MKDNWTSLFASEIGCRIGRSKDAVIARARRRGYRKTASPWKPGDPVPARVREALGLAS